MTFFNITVIQQNDYHSAFVESATLCPYSTNLWHQKNSEEVIHISHIVIFKLG